MSNKDNKGWICLYRKLADDPMWLSEKFTRSQAWIDLIMMAARKPRVMRSNGKMVKLRVGELSKSIRYLSVRWGWGVNKVQDVLNEFEMEGKISILRYAASNTISICNYEKYQHADTETDTQSGTPSTQAEKQADRYRVTSAKPVPYSEKRTLADTETDTETDTAYIGMTTSNTRLDIAEPKGSVSGRDPDAETLCGEAVSYGRLVAFWNEATQGRWGMLRSIDNNRRKMVRARIRANGKEALKEAIRKATASKFLAGAGWFNFDWLIRPNNFDKVLAGNYDNREGEDPIAAGQAASQYETTRPDGTRTYGDGRATVPLDAPPRPSDRHVWSSEYNQWIL